MTMELEYCFSKHRSPELHYATNPGIRLRRQQLTPLQTTFLQAMTRIFLTRFIQPNEKFITSQETGNTFGQRCHTHRFQCGGACTCICITVKLRLSPLSPNDTTNSSQKATRLNQLLFPTGDYASENQSRQGWRASIRRAPPMLMPKVIDGAGTSQFGTPRADRVRVIVPAVVEFLDDRAKAD